MRRALVRNSMPGVAETVGEQMQQELGRAVPTLVIIADRGDVLLGSHRAKPDQVIWLLCAALHSMRSKTASTTQYGVLGSVVAELEGKPQ